MPLVRLGQLLGKVSVLLRTGWFVNNVFLQAVIQYERSVFSCGYCDYSSDCRVSDISANTGKLELTQRFHSVFIKLTKEEPILMKRSPSISNKISGLLCKININCQFLSKSQQPIIHWSFLVVLCHF